MESVKSGDPLDFKVSFAKPVYYKTSKNLDKLK